MIWETAMFGSILSILILTNINPGQTGKKLDPLFRSLARVILDIFTRAGWIVGLSVFDIWYHVSLGVDEAWQRV